MADNPEVEVGQIDGDEASGQFAQDVQPLALTGPKKKNKVGRGHIIKLTEDHLRQIQVMAGYGLPDFKIAAVLGVSVDTFYRNKRLRPEVAEAYARGFAVQETRIGRALVKRAEAGDMPAIRWWEMTRAGRRAASDVTTGGEPVTNLTYVITSAAGELVDEDDKD